MATKIKNEELQVIDYRYDEGIRGRVEHDIVSTITTKASGYSGNPLLMKIERERETSSMLRIRKLTPKECMRLMGFSDEDYESMVEFGLSDSQIYHCAGDSIVVSCIVGLVSQFENLDHDKVITHYVETNIIEERK